MSPRYTSAGAAGATELNTDSAGHEKYGLGVAQTITAIGGALKTADGDSFDAIGFDDVEVSAIIFDESGSVTSVTVWLTESSDDTATGQTVVPGAQLAITTVDPGVAAAFRARCVGLKRYLGVKVQVTGGTSAGVALLLRGLNARDTASAAAPSTAFSSVTLA